jgi:hypothetical protein
VLSLHKHFNVGGSRLSGDSLMFRVCNMYTEVEKRCQYMRGQEMLLSPILFILIVWCMYGLSCAMQSRD